MVRQKVGKKKIDQKSEDIDSLVAEIEGSSSKKGELRSKDNQMVSPSPKLQTKIGATEKLSVGYESTKLLDEAKHQQRQTEARRTLTWTERCRRNFPKPEERKKLIPQLTPEWRAVGRKEDANRQGLTETQSIKVTKEGPADQSREIKIIKKGSNSIDEGVLQRGTVQPHQVRILNRNHSNMGTEEIAADQSLLGVEMIEFIASWIELWLMGNGLTVFQCLQLSFNGRSIGSFPIACEESEIPHKRYLYYQLYMKLQRMKPCLKKLNKDHFADIVIQAEKDQLELQHVQEVLATNPSDLTVQEQERKAYAQFLRSSEASLSFVKQKAKEERLLNSDENFSFFHSKLKARTMRNRIWSVVDENGRLITD
ncbi:OLC1v1018856C1 [Oldenlandia corymbosa var. corymbosa]|uniref:OLC1v1018856C1 n=1 Tax=Oldenlandia corymbosa var. corymbosa TaxID=529605 RepID=A0AAV1ECZ3_OLDCO|nr:OLC1v1018856C1 [Oldenlandia corymbosa var. corymbosa]